MSAHASMRFLFAKVASQAKVADLNMAMFVQQNIGRLQVTIDNEPSVHMLETKQHFRRVESHLLLGEDAMLRKVIVQISAVHQIQQETQFLWSLKRVRHAHNERTALLQTQIQTQHS